MKNFLQQYFQYSRKERSGVIVLLIIILLSFLFPYFYEYFIEEKRTEYGEFEKKIDQFYADQLRLPVKISKKKTKKTKKNIQLFDFDPNTVNKTTLLTLGFSEKQAKNVLNYRKAGGKFYKATDLKKIYSIGDRDYKKWKTFIKIKEKKRTSVTQKKHKEVIVNKEVMQIIELNSADSLDLISLNGIGKVLSERIIRYRTFLGGFHKSEQLLEVYGISPETFDKIREKIRVDTSFIQIKNLNTVTFKALNKHPYITFAQTKAIFKYKKIMGKFKHPKELIKNNLVDSVTYKKVVPYLIAN